MSNQNRIDRRKFLGLTGLTAAAMPLSKMGMAQGLSTTLPTNSFRDKIVPISVAERKQRIAKAQELMAKEKIDAIFLEGTTSCFYFTGMTWGQSERPFGVVIQA